MINKVILIGNVGQEPDIRYAGDATSGAKVATIRLATTERYKDRSGMLQEHTEWHSVVAWRNTADVVEKYVKKGTQIYVEGRLRTRSWEDQTGNKRYTTEIMADTLQLLGRKQDNPAGNSYGAPQQSYSQPQNSYQQPAPVQPAQQPVAQPVQQPVQSQGFADDMPADDLPF